VEEKQRAFYLSRYKIDAQLRGPKTLKIVPVEEFATSESVKEAGN
jgi:hypothetical protein